MFKVLVPLVTILALSACSDKAAQTAPEEETLPTSEQVLEEGEAASAGEALAATLQDENRLSNILMAQPEKVKARYVYRHPQETLEFIGVEPGMTVIEALPGGGWYSKVLLQHLGSTGALIGVDYSRDMYSLFGFMTEEGLEAKKTWTTDWVKKAQTWRDGYKDSAELSAFVFGSMPESFANSADVAFFVRALHNLNRFEQQGGFLTTAMENTYQALKPGGILGIVQHEARPEMPDSWADGSNGYLKKEYLISKLEGIGFEYIDSSDINQNAADQPTEQDVVWRLSPSFRTSRDNPELKAQIQAIGESNRMTLKFRKPE